MRVAKYRAGGFPPRLILEVAARRVNELPPFSWPGPLYTAIRLVTRRNGALYCFGYLPSPRDGEGRNGITPAALGVVVQGRTR